MGVLYNYNYFHPHVTCHMQSSVCVIAHSLTVAYNGSLLPPKRLRSTRHLSVCLLATSHKNYWSVLGENFTRDVSVDEEELSKFWKSSGSRSSSYLKDSSTLWDGPFFHTLVHISGRPDWMFMKILSHVYLWQRSKCQVMEVIIAGVLIWTPDTERIHLSGGLHSCFFTAVRTSCIR